VGHFWLLLWCLFCGVSLCSIGDAAQILDVCVRVCVNPKTREPHNLTLVGINRLLDRGTTGLTATDLPSLYCTLDVSTPGVCSSCPRYACRALGSLTGLLNDAPALVKLAGQDDGRLAVSTVSKGTPLTSVVCSSCPRSACRALGSLTGHLDDAPALVELAGQDDGRLTVSIVSKGTPSTNRPAGRTDGR